MGEKETDAASLDSKYSKEEVAHQEQAPFVYSDAEKKLVRKMNWRFAPFLLVILFLQVKYNAFHTKLFTRLLIIYLYISFLTNKHYLLSVSWMAFFTTLILIKTNMAGSVPSSTWATF